MNKMEEKKSLSLIDQIMGQINYEYHSISPREMDRINFRNRNSRNPEKETEEDIERLIKDNTKKLKDCISESCDFDNCETMVDIFKLLRCLSREPEYNND